MKDRKHILPRAAVQWAAVQEVMPPVSHEAPRYHFPSFYLWCKLPLVCLVCSVLGYEKAFPAPWSLQTMSVPLSLNSVRGTTMSGTEVFDPYFGNISSGSIPRQSSSRSTKLVHCASSRRGQEAGGSRYCHEPGHNGDACGKHLELMPAWVNVHAKPNSLRRQPRDPQNRRRSHST